MSELPMDVYKVIHTKDDVETVYLVAARSVHDAKTQVIDQLYDRTHKIHWTPEEKSRDVFGLMQDTGEYTNRKVCEDNGCSVNATPFRPDPPYKLYAINRVTGEMSF